MDFLSMSLFGEIVTQIGMAVFGLLALHCAMGHNTTLRRWAPVVGLMGQPFWFVAAVNSRQWGMLVLTAAYTLIYWRGLRLHWGHPRL